MLLRFVEAANTLSTPLTAAMPAIPADAMQAQVS
jgi:hypothetical protein